MPSPLSQSASPYLRAHAGNPVAWFGWGEAAFAEARRRDVPLLISIGYSTCHWCHVMARESFQDAATATVINTGFVPVKVDREEHPEVDRAYLSAAAAFTPHLGWPLTVFATPDGDAFYAGTYWPPAARGGQPAFVDVLAAVTEAWTTRRGEVAETGAAVRAALTEAAALPSGPAPDEQDLREAAQLLAGYEDRRFGGFAAATAPMTTPKFPTVPALRFLRSPLVVRAEPDAAAVATRALAAMVASPLRDPVDGGFFRYGTRRDWSAPHYERMLTDNAGLVELALETGDRAAAAGAVRFLLEVLERPEGGFGAAQDSESWIAGGRSEGGYYARDAAGRAELDPPAVDGKIVTGWNGAAVSALARYATVTGDGRALAGARRAVDTVLTVNRGGDGQLRRASLDEVVSPAPATLEDQGLLAIGLTDLACATGEVAYARLARDLVDAAADADGAADPVLRGLGLPPGEESDGDHPSGPAALAAAALRLWWLGAGEAYREIVERTVGQRAGRALAEPAAHGALLRVCAELCTPPRQVVVVGAPAGHPLRAAAGEVDAEVVAFADEMQAAAFAASGFALFEARGLRDGRPAVYDCRGFACRLPVTDAALLPAAR